MLIEDQYGVGDVIDAGPATGTVEGVSLRTTRLRDIEGNVWHIPNGVIERVADKSQDWSRALLDVSVAYDADPTQAGEIIRRAAEQMRQDPAWSHDFRAEPEMWGVESLGSDGVIIRLVVKTAPLAQWREAGAAGPNQDRPAGREDRNSLPAAGRVAPRRHGRRQGRALPGRGPGPRPARPGPGPVGLAGRLGSDRRAGILRAWVGCPMNRRSCWWP